MGDRWFRQCVSCDGAIVQLDDQHTAPVLRVGDQIQVDVVLVNLTDHGIPKPKFRQDTRCYFRIQVKSKTGLATSEPDCNGSHSLDFAYSWKPKESVVAHVLLTGESEVETKLDFSVPGNYVVHLFRFDSDKGKDVKSNKITIKVLPAGSHSKLLAN